MSEIALKAEGLAVQPRSLRIRRRINNLLMLSICLIAAGIVGSFSTTVFLRIAQGLPPYTAFVKHLLFIALGIALSAALVALFNKHWRIRAWLKYVIPFSFYISLLLVAAVKLTGYGVDVNGAFRGLDLGFIRFQPSELLKVLVVLYLAQLLCWWRKPPLPWRAKDESKDEPQHWLAALKAWLTSSIKERPIYPDLPKRCMLILLASVGFTVIQPDLGSACIILAAGIITAVIAGVRLQHLLVFGLVLFVIGMLAILVVPGKYQYARERVTTWLHPLENADSSAFQITQARGAVASAGLWGKGYLRSDQKMNRLPLSTNDFVFPIMVEELGFIGGMAIIGLFVTLALFGIQLSSELEEPFARTAVAALGLTICLQGLVNIGTTIGTLPLSGMTLPFFSQGGTSLIISTMALGTMLALGVSGMQQARFIEMQEFQARR